MSNMFDVNVDTIRGSIRELAQHQHMLQFGITGRCAKYFVVPSMLEPSFEHDHSHINQFIVDMSQLRHFDTNEYIYTRASANHINMDIHNTRGVVVFPLWLNLVQLYKDLCIAVQVSTKRHAHFDHHAPIVAAMLAEMKVVHEDVYRLAVTECHNNTGFIYKAAHGSNNQICILLFIDRASSLNYLQYPFGYMKLKKQYAINLTWTEPVPLFWSAFVENYVRICDYLTDNDLLSAAYLRF